MMTIYKLKGYKFMTAVSGIRTPSQQILRNYFIFLHEKTKLHCPNLYHSDQKYRSSVSDQLLPMTSPFRVCLARKKVRKSTTYLFEFKNRSKKVGLTKLLMT